MRPVEAEVVFFFEPVILVTRSGINTQNTHTHTLKHLLL